MNHQFHIKLLFSLGLALIASSYATECVAADTFQGFPEPTYVEWFLDNPEEKVYNSFSADSPDIVCLRGGQLVLIPATLFQTAYRHHSNCALSIHGKANRSYLKCHPNRKPEEEDLSQN